MEQYCSSACSEIDLKGLEVFLTQNYMVLAFKATGAIHVIFLPSINYKKVVILLVLQPSCRATFQSGLQLTDIDTNYRDVLFALSPIFFSFKNMKMSRCEAV